MILCDLRDGNFHFQQIKRDTAYGVGNIATSARIGTNWGIIDERKSFKVYIVRKY